MSDEIAALVGKYNQWLKDKTALRQVKAKDILIPYTFTITPSTPLKEAIQLMDKRKIEHLIVVSDRPGSKAILGLLHIEDIVDRMAQDEER